jgi:hypothetical protein
MIWSMQECIRTAPVCSSAQDVDTGFKEGGDIKLLDTGFKEGGDI